MKNPVGFRTRRDFFYFCTTFFIRSLIMVNRKKLIE